MAARLPRIRVIAGPTAVGKTSYSLQLAKEYTNRNRFCRQQTDLSPIDHWHGQA